MSPADDVMTHAFGNDSAVVGLAVVGPVVHVLAVGAGVGKPLETLLALEWFLAAVEPLVLREVVLVLEGFVA